MLKLKKDNEVHYDANFVEFLYILVSNINI
jgi:hypothetical protein